MDKETLINGDFKQTAILFVTSYAGLTYVNPKLFEFLDKQFNCCQASLFKIWCILYLLLPLIGFFLVLLMRRRKNIGLVQWKHIKFKTKWLIGGLVLVLAIANMFFFQSPCIAGSTTDSFSELRKFNILNDTYKKSSEELLTEVNIFCLRMELNQLLDTHQPKMPSEWYAPFDSLVNTTLRDSCEPKLTFHAPFKNDLIVTRDSLFWKYLKVYITNWNNGAITKVDQGNIRLTFEKLDKYYRTAVLDKVAASVKSKFDKNFKAIRIIYLMEILCILIILSLIYYAYSLQGRQSLSEGFVIRILLGLYLLIGFQLVDKNSFECIKVDNKGFQYRVAGWYAPSFLINTFSQVNNHDTDNSTKAYHGMLDAQELNEKLDNLMKMNTKGLIDSNKNGEQNDQLIIGSFSQKAINELSSLIQDTTSLQFREIKKSLDTIIDEISSVNSKVNSTKNEIVKFRENIRTGGTYGN